jgi:hypothetical protein
MPETTKNAEESTSEEENLTAPAEVIVSDQKQPQQEVIEENQ